MTPSTQIRQDQNRQCDSDRRCQLQGQIAHASPVHLTVYDNKLSGSLAANLAGSLPAVNVALTTDVLDLNKLLSGLGRQRADMGGEGRRMLADAGGGAIVAKPNKVGGGGAGWSDTKIDFSPLRTINAKLKLTAKQLLYELRVRSPESFRRIRHSCKLQIEWLRVIEE